MTKRLVEIWHERNCPLLSERGLKLILRERGLNEKQIQNILKEISFSDLAKKVTGAAKSVATKASATAGKLTSSAMNLKATRNWKKYAAGAGIDPNNPTAEDFLEWLEDTYNMPENLIARINLGAKNIVDVAENENRLLNQKEVENLLLQISREEFKHAQSGGRYGKNRYNAGEFINDPEVQNALKDMIISPKNWDKLKNELVKDPNYLNNLLDRVLQTSTT